MASLVQGVRAVLSRSSACLRVAPRAAAVAVQQRSLHIRPMAAVAAPTTSLLHNARVRMRVCVSVCVYGIMNDMGNLRRNLRQRGAFRIAMGSMERMQVGTVL